ncbi:F-box/FBD/LRR-repeat protein [Pyrus ussuriensis x Pyrus communis]|uniref:F-box/FBD/LRR-repeat protein n=1 Tax=Pyrus ussuriensis x Pyrus communis TaxID=2448454 RepID=A0A5N5GEI1_9ROSA|nr:F-box/FBD/LRR-repeat protein [Pyrus ussuriensis x Pyrus communis]
MKLSQIALPASASASASDEVEDTDAKINKDDRFSGLPDEVVHRILSPLPYSDVIRVGTLSKRCRQLLASLDNFFSRRQLANGKDKIGLQTFDLEWEFLML